MNEFGGNWTSQKIVILEKYTRAYLEIMKARLYWKLVYFDGFAGAGDILVTREESSQNILGAAKTILSIDSTRVFDIYYFVELNPNKTQKLKAELGAYTNRKIYVTSDDCNIKLKHLSSFLQERKDHKDEHKALVFLDPFGMALKWESLQSLKGLGVDVWILVPTGVGANRLLTTSGTIPDTWFSKLESFFGIDRKLIMETFYEKTATTNLFGEAEERNVKNERAVKRIIELYTRKLKEIFDHVSQPYEMKNSTSSVMYHFVLASNNANAVKIANDVIRQINK